MAIATPQVPVRVQPRRSAKVRTLMRRHSYSPSPPSGGTVPRELHYADIRYTTKIINNKNRQIRRLKAELAAARAAHAASSSDEE